MSGVLSTAVQLIDDGGTHAGVVFDDQVMDGSLRLCIRATQTRSGSEKMRSLACRKNKARFRTALIGYTMIGLTVLSNRISSSENRESGDRHRSDLLIKLSNTKRPQMIMCKMVFAY